MMNAAQHPLDIALLGDCLVEDFDDSYGGVSEKDYIIVNLKENPETFTGYLGAIVWEAIYQENCLLDKLFGNLQVAADPLVPEEVRINAWTLAPQIPPNCWGRASKFAQRDACSRTQHFELKECLCTKSQIHDSQKIALFDY